MPHIGIETHEQYPAYAVVSRDHALEHGLPVHEVEQATLDRWAGIEQAHAQMREEIDRLVRPRCGECDHPQVRHQEWSSGWGTWGCLVKVPSPERIGSAVRTCGCQHGIPADRTTAP